VPEHLLVTGGSSGIGAAVARAAVGRGHTVTFTYATDEQRARRLTDELAPSASAIRWDAREPRHASAVFEAATAERGPVDALVNNAGVTGPLGSFLETSEEKLRTVFEVNFFAALALSREAVAQWLTARRAGVIVNVSSIAASTGAPGEYVGYAASKAAIETFTQGLGRELAPHGIRVGAVAPGTTDTPIHSRAGDPDRPKRVAQRIPMGRVARPVEIAEAILWAVSREASYCTATTISVAGGL
jgi:NAD(P)-dependent dehydrogenase (short-subunit alcohol dehydrogenase family)